MRQGGSKSKGGKYENEVARKIADVFSRFDITEDDCYRSKNSGATLRQPGDIQLSPALAKIFPVLIECKHYRAVKFDLFRPLHQQPKTYHIRIWWEQLMRDRKKWRNLHKGRRASILVMRQNRCKDLCAIWVKDAEFLGINWKSNGRIFTKYKRKRIVIMPLDVLLASRIVILFSMRKKTK